MAASTGNGWAQLRQQARGLETQTETLFHTYSQYSSTSKIPATPSEDEQKTEAQIKELFEKVCLMGVATMLNETLTFPQRENIISQLSRLLDSEATLTSSALKQNNLSRHREILREHQAELSRIRAQISTNRDRANLLSNVRSDINAYRTSNPGDSEADYMLEERQRIDRSHSTVDGVLSQAYAINDSFSTQREALSNVNRKIVSAASQIPGVNTLIGKIGSKKRRDGIILGSFIAFCFLVLLYFL